MGLRRGMTEQRDEGSRPSTPLLASYALNPAQARFLACGERFSLYVGGVGAGKTFAGAARAITWMIEQPGSRWG